MMSPRPHVTVSTPPPLEAYRTLVETSPAMMWRTTEHGACDYVSPAWLAFTGDTPEAIRGGAWAERVHPDDVEPWRTALERALAEPRPFERCYRLRRHDGVYRRVLDRAAPFESAPGTFGGFAGVCIDIEDVRIDRDPLPLDDFFEMSLDHVCIAGFDGYLKRVSPSWTRTLGWTAEELLARPSIEFVHPEDREKTLAGRQRLKQGAPLGPFVNRYLCKDGGFRWFEWRSVAHPERGLVYAVARDITEQKNAEEKLRQSKELQETLQRQLVFADRMASVGTLAAGVAHEINNPLAYVSTNLGLVIEELGALAGETPSPRVADIKEMAVEAQSGAERIRKIVRGLKTFSRSEQERRTVVEIGPLLELSINMAWNEIRHRARLVKDFGRTPPVEADEARLGQVFINLLVNAAQAIPEGDAAGHEIRVLTGTDERGHAVVQVVDTGVGIPAEVLGRVFDPFFTTKPIGVGTGLGLSICHSIVSAIGGQISLDSTEGRGTTARVVLPPATTPAATTRSGAGTPTPPPARASVLVVDDEPAIGVGLRRLLRDHDVTAVTSGREALVLLDAGRRFDVVFSDVMMPEMSGMELHTEILRRFPDVAPKMVFVSGGAFTPTAVAFLDRIANERIEKPFDPRAVRELVRRYASDRSADEPRR